MILIHVMGGLGNQLYQYALYEKLKTLGKEVKLDTYAYYSGNDNEKEWRPLELDRFPNINYAAATASDRELFLDNSASFVSRIRRKLFGRKDRTVMEVSPYMPEIYDMDNVYLYGYWNCERYYEDIIPMLWEKLQFPLSSDMRNQAILQQIENENSVSLHVRRTDYLKVADGARYMGICTGAYYKSAMSYIEQRIDRPVYYIFSDDPEYVKEHYRGINMHVIDWNGERNSIFDLQIMSKCKHNICANSTFSMWGARLNQNTDKIMIRPLHHDNYETTTTEQIQKNWKNWILVDQNGHVCV